MMKRYKPWSRFCLLVLLALSVQGCFGIGDNNSSNTAPINTGTGHQVNVTQNVFKGKLYFTIDRNLWMLDGTTSKTLQLTKGKDVRDPAVSPDGKWIAFIIRSKNSSDLVYISTSGGPIHTLLSGQGKFYSDGPFTKSTHNWFAQPAWAEDSKSLIFLSDLQKDFFWSSLGGFFQEAPFLDMQVFSIPLVNPPSKDVITSSNAVAYANYGDGGDRDPGYRPHHPTEIVYTHYAYDATGTNQVIQIFLEDATAIARHPGKYYPGYDPGVAVTPDKVENIQPAFSPDGNSIAYIRREDDGQMGLYIMPVPDGVTDNPNDPEVIKKALLPYQQSTLIQKQQFVSQPAWSPDGKQIAYLAYNNQTFDIWLANLNFNAQTGKYSMKGNPIQLTTGGIDGDSRPFWTP